MTGGADGRAPHRPAAPPPPHTAAHPAADRR